MPTFFCSHRKMANLPGWVRPIKKPKSTVDFKLSGSQQDVAHIYRTKDEIKGEILFKPGHDLEIHAVHITLEGNNLQTMRYILLMQAGIAYACIWDREINWQTHYPSVTHRFMRLHQPLDPPFLSGAVLEGGRTHRFPFVFVVPAGLLPQACRHAHTHPEVRDHHLQLPPSLGFESQRKEKGFFPLSLDPASASVTYGIRFSVFKLDRATNQPVCAINTARKIHILPTLPEMPPLFMPMDGIYRLSKELIVRGLKGSKLGRLTARATQPQAIRLGHIESEPMRPTETILPIDFRFLPTCYNQPPPRPKKIRSQLTAVTYFGIEPLEDLPDRTRKGYSPAYRRLFSRTVSLASHDITSVRWEKQQSGPTQPEEQFQEAESTMPKASDEANFRMSIALPIALPKHYVYTPTFFSCFVSRAYSLRVEVSFDVHHKLPFTGTISLTVPIQISSESALETRCRTKID